MKNFLSIVLRNFAWQNALVGICLFLLCMIPSWSIFAPNMFLVHDFVHGSRITEILTGLKAGHIPVRWSDHFGYGYGMPLYIFYAPLPYYFGAIIYWISNDLIVSIKSLSIVANCVSVIGGYFLGLRLTKSKRGGILVAVLIGFAPYRALNLFVRGAISESWGIMFIPWLWYGIIGLLEGDLSKKVVSTKNTVENLGEYAKYFISLIQKYKSDWFITIAASVGIMLSHNLTTLITFPITGLIIVLWFFMQVALTRFTTQFTSSQIIKLILRVISAVCAILLAIGIASFYLIPMFFEINFIRTATFLQGYFDFRLHFLYIRQFFNPTWKYGGSTLGPDDGLSFFIGWPILFATFVFAVYITSKLVTYIKNRVQISSQTKKSRTSLIGLQFFEQKDFQTILWLLIFGLISGIVLFFSLYKSLFIWESLSIIQNLQFPWRWMSITVTSLAIIPALIFKLIHKKSLQFLLIALCMSTAFFHVSYFTPEVWLETPSDLYYDDPLKIQTHMSDIMLDYLPTTLIMNKNGNADLLPTATDTSLVGGLDPHETFNPIFNASNFSNPIIHINFPHQKLLLVTTDEPTDFVWTIANFPGWETKVDGAFVESFTTEQGLLGMKLEPGTHTVEALFTNTRIRTIADTITGISLTILISTIILSQNAHTKIEISSKKKRT